MSHLTPIKAKLQNAELVIAALKAMGLNPQVNFDQPMLVQNTWSEHGYRQDAYHAVILVPAAQIAEYCRSDVGFVQTDDGLHLISDYSELVKWNYNSQRNPDRLDFVQQLHEQYALAGIRQQGQYAIGKRTVVNGEVQYVLTPIESSASSMYGGYDGSGDEEQSSVYAGY